MLYQRKSDPRLEKELFENPTSEYRGAPFWSWNTKLEQDELLWQIEQLKAMGFGGFHMHTRAGMATEYLGKEFMELIRACNEKAKAEKMLAWLYDEDRWPSGFAGGLVTKEPKYRQKFIRFTVEQMPDATDAKTGYETGRPYLLSCYDVSLYPNGTLRHYEQIKEHESAQGTKWYVYACTQTPTGRYNGQTYVDTMSEEAVAEFIRVTYDAYFDAVGSDFGGSVPAIFTDEPQLLAKEMLPFAASKQDVRLPYTTDFAQTFREAYGFDLLAHLPELLWDLPDHQPSKARYCYHDHTSERFTKAFSDQCGKWCEKHGLALTGHLMSEDTLLSQTKYLGEAMRSYRNFTLPGIDVLNNQTLFATAKQCQSAVHQYGREGMMSELYGVTNWDFDFRGHKAQGDWQAALGVTVRVPHLSWVTMKGSAKRDYPASINYQSTWYKEYTYIEDHFARVNTAMTRGTPSVKVAVLHPVESIWLHFGPDETTADLRAQLQQNFDSVTDWLLRNTIDFDYISEALLPGLHQSRDDTLLGVGKMAYAAVIVPGMETMRTTTLEILKDFSARGGKVIFLGDCPKFVDAECSDAVRPLYDRAIVTPFTASSLLNALEEERDLLIRQSNGLKTNDLIYQMREDGDQKWIFIAHVKQPDKKPKNEALITPRELSITVKGEYTPTVYDSITGKTRPTVYSLQNGNTVISEKMFCHDSLLLCLDQPSKDLPTAIPASQRNVEKVIECMDKAEYSLSEPNVLVLDIGQLSRDGIHYEPREELLRIDRKLRSALNFPMADGRDMQPWVIEEEQIMHFPYVKFVFTSETEAACRLAYEEVCEVIFNGENVPIVRDGFFTDHQIYTMPMPSIRKGKNELIVRFPFGKRVSLENFFLLGSFGVRTEGSESIVTALPDRLAFGSIVHQGLPFYGANITYRMEFKLEKEQDIAIRTELYRGALIDARLDGKEIGKIVFSPYRLTCNGLCAGKHILELTLFASRINCFGCLHNCTYPDHVGPSQWYTRDASWSYEYTLRDVGIMKAPVIEILK